MQRFHMYLRFALRQLRRSPGFAAAAITTLALGIGANTAVFSVVNAVLLRSPPYPHPDRIVRVYEVRKSPNGAVSPPDFTDWREGARSFGALAAYNAGAETLTGYGDPQPVPAANVTQDFFAAIGVVPAIGRPFTAAEEQVGQTDVAILGDGLWRRSFGARPDVIGRTIQLDGRSVRVVGVMPPGFDFPDGSQVWSPFAFSPQDLATQRGAHYLGVVGRLAPGATLEGANSELSVLASRLAAQFPNTNKGAGARAVPLHDALVGAAPRRALLILLGAVALVALIACVNVANLLLARGAMRQRELAVRAALGATPRDLVSMSLVESVVLALVGGACALLIATWAASGLGTLRPAELRQIGDVRIDSVVLAFTFALAVGTGLLFGIAPALQLIRTTNVHGVLASGGRAHLVSREGWRVRAGLVASELALAVMLLVGAGLLIKSFRKLLEVHPGFDPGDLATAYISLPDARYPKPERRALFYQQLVERAAAVPGVRSAAAISGLPLDGYYYSITTIALDGQDIPSAQQPSTQIRQVTPALFQALRVPLLEGRVFSAADRMDAPRVIVVNESAARLLWPGVDPVGHTATIGMRPVGTERPGGAVVGVVGDIHDEALGTPPRPTIYLAEAQFPTTDMAVALRVAPGTDPLAVVPALRSSLRALDPALPLTFVRTMDRVAQLSVAEQRFAMLLLVAFAALAAALAAVGIYGVMAYVVGQRTREIGVRMALGAPAEVVVGETLRRAVLPVLVGVGAGVAGALALTQLMARLLFEVEPADPATFCAVAVGLALLALLAAYLPARRASRVDPLMALRSE